MLRNEKEAVIAEVAQLLTDTDNLFVSDYRGLTVAELADSMLFGSNAVRARR